MRYPVTPNGTKAEFDEKWYIAQGFGNATSYGYHEGADVNLKTGGDTDLGQELKAVAKGKVVFYHLLKHPTYGFGRHLIEKIEGPWGVRWSHFAHCSDQDFLGSAVDVNEGQIVARIGKSGTPYAHLHWSMFKVDPSTLPQGIDTIAKTFQQLNEWWEDPIKFVDTWMATPAPVPGPVITDPSTKLDFKGITAYPGSEIYNILELGTTGSKLIAKDIELKTKNAKILELEGKIAKAKADLA